MGFRPEEKGIKTTDAVDDVVGVQGWDSDLKKKGLRLLFPTVSDSVGGRWDSDLKKKGLRPCRHAQP